jgi:hypothetical protein
MDLQIKMTWKNSVLRPIQMTVRQLLETVKAAPTAKLVTKLQENETKEWIGTGKGV